MAMRKAKIAESDSAVGKPSKRAATKFGPLGQDRQLNEVKESKGRRVKGLAAKSVREDDDMKPLKNAKKFHARDDYDDVQGSGSHPCRKKNGCRGGK